MPGLTDKLVVGGNLHAKDEDITDVDTADATDLATAQALANANKAKINALLAILRDNGVIITQP